MKRILTYGTFDLLHWGHINLLRRAKEMGDYLIVALSTDDFNEIKGKKAYHSYDERKKMLESIRYVDLVIPENTWEQKEEDIQEYKVDVLVMGNDWEGKFDHLNSCCLVSYLPRTDGISTTKIKNDLEIKK
ncbi:MAG: glycerol-3-phosphate cytidylyltransferase [Anaerorhabdus sp.]